MNKSNLKKTANLKIGVLCISLKMNTVLRQPLIGSCEGNEGKEHLVL